MRIRLLFILLALFSFKLCAQIIYPIDVSDEFKKRYSKQKLEFNPLHVGDIFQYGYEDYEFSYNILKDTMVDNKKYYYKTYGKFHNWERNDSLIRTSYKLDVEDLNDNGRKDDELLIDSLDVNGGTEFTSYKYAWRDASSELYYTAIVWDTTWAYIYGDTVMIRKVNHQLTENWIADKYGLIITSLDSPWYFLSGAIINGIKYGNMISTEENEIEIPDRIYLSNNYPNPFNPSTKINFELPKESYVKLLIYNLLGEKIETLISEYKRAGAYDVKFDAHTLSSGVYFYILQTNGTTITKKMLLLK
ncbi:MAG TPA: T9SS type A sorting domain-containing protein [Ignavibacteriales bacterium]|nr:T9SS type A sorting domain-containing protein [Ignavibacteriales bacterium]HEX3074614.1 T9SS type A sorting domain-containing protein [Ignavibacteriales bacterium]